MYVYIYIYIYLFIYLLIHICEGSYQTAGEDKVPNQDSIMQRPLARVPYSSLSYEYLMEVSHKWKASQRQGPLEAGSRTNG